MTDGQRLEKILDDLSKPESHTVTKATVIIYIVFSVVIMGFVIFSAFSFRGRMYKKFEPMIEKTVERILQEKGIEQRF